jgi:hypothetical protein
MARRKGINYNPLQHSDFVPDPFGCLPPPSTRETILTVMSALGEKHPGASFGELVEEVKAAMGDAAGDDAFLEAAQALLAK